jgi:alpha-beta hydrolase superfamily lysophospholipase
LRRLLEHLLLALSCGVLCTFAGVVGLYLYLLEDRPELKLWHTVDLDSEFTAARAAEVSDFNAYLGLEARLFEQLDDRVIQQIPQSQRQQLDRFSRGSLSDPARRSPNWNHSFQIPVERPRGGVLLLHGLSDSPYSWRAMGELLHRQGFWVVGLRLPGHGTAPSGLVHATWEDFAAATRLAARHVRARIGVERPFYIGGYSNGAALAVEYSLAVLEGEDLPAADALLLLSPAIGVSPMAALAVWQARLGDALGLDKLAWNSIQPEYDPYKYNSFAVNAGDQIYQLTRQIAARLERLDRGRGVKGFPRVLAFQSVVDATIEASALIDVLFRRLAPEGHELVLFDINRHADAESLFVAEPEHLTGSLLADDSLPFTLTLVSNVSPDSDAVHAVTNAPFTLDTATEPLGLQWPKGVYSLSHVAVPFPPDDPLYGGVKAAWPDPLRLGRAELRGESGVLVIPASQLIRLRYNPFFSYLERRTLAFLGASTDSPHPGPAG